MRQLRKTNSRTVEKTLRQAGLAPPKGKRARQQQPVLATTGGGPVVEIHKLSWRERQTTLYRCRKSLLPYLFAGGLVGIAEGLYYGRQVDPASAKIAGVSIVLLAVLGSLCVWVRARKRLLTDRLWGNAIIVAAALWLGWSLHRGIDPTNAFVLLLTMVVFGLRWWPRVRQPYPPKEKQPEHPVGETIPQAWASFVSSPKGCLTGVPLGDLTKEKHADAYTVPLPRDGSITVSSVFGMLERLQQALNVPLEDIIWSKHPHPKMQYAGILKIVTKSPIKKPVFFDKPRMINGSVLLGPYADGASEAMWQVYTENSMWGGFIVGVTGSGKSRLIEEIALTLRSRGDTQLWYCDGQNGGSSAYLNEHAEWSVPAKDFDDMLDALERIAEYRQDKLIDSKVPGFTPSPEYPGIQVILDEFQILLQDPGRQSRRTAKRGVRNRTRAERLDELAATTRKIGISFILATQASGLEMFDGKDRLRANVQARNTVVMKMKSRIAQQLIPNFFLDATKLPPLAGYAYTVESEDPDGAKTTQTAPFRARWLLSEDELTKHPECPYPSLDKWFDLYPQVELDERSAYFAGDVYATRVERFQAEVEARRRRMQGLTPLPRSAADEDEPESEYYDGDDEDTDSAGVPFTPGWTMPDVPEPPKLGRYSPGDVDLSGLSVPTGLSEVETNVFVAIAKGCHTPSAIANHLGYKTPRSISDHLANLIRAGHISKDGEGRAVEYKIQRPDQR
jgi:hypothetical protein